MSDETQKQTNLYNVKYKVTFSKITSKLPRLYGPCNIRNNRHLLPINKEDLFSLFLEVKLGFKGDGWREGTTTDRSIYDNPQDKIIDISVKNDNYIILVEHKAIKIIDSNIKEILKYESYTIPYTQIRDTMIQSNLKDWYNNCDVNKYTVTINMGTPAFIKPIISPKTSIQPLSSVDKKTIDLYLKVINPTGITQANLIPERQIEIEETYTNKIESLLKDDTTLYCWNLMDINLFNDTGKEKSNEQIAYEQYTRKDDILLYNKWLNMSKDSPQAIAESSFCMANLKPITLSSFSKEKGNACLNEYAKVGTDRSNIKTFAEENCVFKYTDCPAADCSLFEKDINTKIKDYVNIYKSYVTCNDEYTNNRGKKIQFTYKCNSDGEKIRKERSLAAKKLDFKDNVDNLSRLSNINKYYFNSTGITEDNKNTFKEACKFYKHETIDSIILPCNDPFGKSFTPFQKEYQSGIQRPLGDVSLEKTTYTDICNKPEWTKTSLDICNTEV